MESRRITKPRLGIMTTVFIRAIRDGSLWWAEVREALSVEMLYMTDCYPSEQDALIAAKKWADDHNATVRRTSYGTPEIDD